VTLLGRGSQVINTGGEKVFPEEVEEALKRFPGVRDAAVVGVPDPRFGERIVALVELEVGSQEVGEEILRDHIRVHLAGYKVPRRILLLSALGRGPNGKLDYAALKVVAAALKG
jgi:acyl-CoA synthetase (AMP-forming)/AMP-acid ligase II